MTLSDSQLDQRLRQTPLPKHLLAGLREIPADEEIARGLNDLSAPDGMQQRLHAVLAECVIETELGSVPRLGEAVTRLHQIPWETVQRRRRMGGWLVGLAAAALAVLVHVAGIYGLAEVARQPEPIPEMRMVVDIGPLRLQSPPAESPLVIGPTFETSALAAVEDFAPQIAPPLQADLAPWSDVVELINSEADLDKDMILAKWGVLGAPNDPEATTPVLEDVSIEPPRGVEPPLLRGAYDRGFLLRENESPPLSPKMHPALAHSRPPLTTRTDSVDLLRRLSKQGRLADEDEIRVEDFLAAQHYIYPQGINPQQRGLSLTTAGGPSPFSPNQAWLMQIGVGTDAVRRNPAPTHWTLAIDVSSGMAWRNRLAEVQRMTERLFREMRESDRLSVVAFREDAWLAAELVTRDQAPEILQMMSQWEPRGRCDFAVGVGRGLSAAVEGGFEGQRRLVVVSDGRASWPRTVSGQILGLQRRAKKLKVDWQWIELSDSDGASSAMVRRLRAAGAKARQTRGEGEIAWLLLEDWYGGSMLSGTDAQLHLQFEPKSVRFHRLVGHKASAWAGVQPLEHRIDLRQGQEATALYEVWITPQGPSLLATATLEWKDPKTGEPRRLRRRILRSDFAASFTESEPMLQQAALAAEAGEVLSRSFFAANRTRTLRDVIALASKADAELQQREDFRRFVKWLRELERIRQRRGD